MTDLLASFLFGRATAADLDALQMQLWRWLADPDGPPLERYLATGARRRLRRQLRDLHLRQAAALLRTPDPWRRAEALAEICRRVEARGPRQTDVDLILADAARFGRLDLSARQLLNILD